MSTTEIPDPAATAEPGPGRPGGEQRGGELEAATDAHIDLERAVLPTEVSATVAGILIAAFCIPLLIVPVVQIFLESSGRQRPQLASLFHQAPTRESLHQYEQDVAANSVFKQFVQPRLQLAMSETTGVGNGKVYIGRDGVLFYRPGMDFVTGRGILDPGRIRTRRKHLVDAGEHSAEPDPRPAILAFNKDCTQAGVHLIVVPVPDKVTVMPAAAGIYERPPPGSVVNVDYPRFVDELRGAGVDVFDPLSLVSAAGPELYLKQDTHWTPEWMDAVAGGIANHIASRSLLPGSSQTVKYRTEKVAVQRVGDLVDMLGLPADQTLFPAQEVQIERPINASTNASVTANESAEVVLLGDSFANIYTAPPMGWGDSAGLGPTLARHLQREIDVIAINGKGASGTRAELARRSKGLSGKRVIVWEFAVRELTDASWDVIPLSGSSAAPVQQQPADTSGLVVEATIEKVSKVPEPYSVPYPDCLTFVVMRVDRVVQGAYPDDRVLAVLWAMKKNTWLPPAKYAPGRKMRVTLIPLRDADESVKTGQRADDTNDYTHRPYFVTKEQEL